MTHALALHVWLVFLLVRFLWLDLQCVTCWNKWAFVKNSNNLFQQRCYLYTRVVSMVFLIFSSFSSVFLSFPRLSFVLVFLSFPPFSPVFSVFLSFPWFPCFSLVFIPRRIEERLPSKHFECATLALWVFNRAPHLVMCIAVWWWSLSAAVCAACWVNFNYCAATYQSFASTLAGDNAPCWRKERIRYFLAAWTVWVL